MKYCLNCFQLCEGEKCAACGFEEKSEERLPQHLPAETVVQGRYQIGRVLGQGGFGITYKAYDRELMRVVAIKEYYPADMAQRTQGQNTVTAYQQGEMPLLYQRGKEKFMEEARTLAKFSDFPGIVRLYDCFAENGTAYIVMQFLEGIDLGDYLEGKGGKISGEEAKQILLPVIDALKEVHRTGMIHRDISPQNIFITTTGQIKVIDFGAARAAVLGDEKSRSVLLKPGYAPEEQYRTHGKQGPWTDVYALSATLYRMVTGKVPPDALERLHEGGELPLPSELSSEIRYAIQKGMAVRASERFESMEALQDVLYGEKMSEDAWPQRTSIQKQTAYSGPNDGGNIGERTWTGGQTVYAPVSATRKKKRNWPVVLIVSVSIFLILGMIVFLFYMLMNTSSGSSVENHQAEVQSTDVQITEEPYVQPVFSMITASRKTTATSNNRAYGANLAYDKQTDTAWNVPGGVGEWIELSGETDQKIKGIRILNGYTKYSPDYGMWIYYANSRPKDITITFSDGTYLTYTLQDIFQAGSYDYQTIDFGETKITKSIRITVNSIYAGNKWNDCCISEIEAY